MAATIRLSWPDEVGGLGEDGAGGRHVHLVWRNKFCCALQVSALGPSHALSLGVLGIQSGNYAYSLGTGGLFVGKGLPAAFAGRVVASIQLALRPRSGGLR